MRLLLSGTGLFLLSFFYCVNPVSGQGCSTLGQTPGSAFPVCGTTIFQQQTVPLCSTHDLFVPGCSSTPPVVYRDLNPFWYKFTCYQAGTLGFVITPIDPDDDYDWQLYDVTGLEPTAVFTNQNIIVTGNWAATPGPTGTSANGADFIQCASRPEEQKSTFARMPSLIAGHQYLLLVSNFSSTQKGYGLELDKGNAVITDPTEPHLQSVSTDCDGKKLRLKLNKRIRCNSLTATGNEFSLSPATATVVSAVSNNCSAGFDFDEITLTLSNSLPPDNYQLIINNGADGNTLIDNCGQAIGQGEQISFRYIVPQPIFADSIGQPGCAPQSIKIYFPKKIDCSTIAADGSDFSIAGPAPVSITGAGGDCINGQTSFVTVQFASPIVNKGTYTVTLKAGLDGTTIVDECGVELPVHTRTFNAADTVTAAFDYTVQLDCRKNTVFLTHNGAHDINSWNWIFNNAAPVTTQNPVVQFPSSSNNTITLTVSNGVCTSTATKTLVMDNEVKAAFEIPPIICPEDPLKLANTSSGLVDQWQWNFGDGRTSDIKDPATFLYPATNIEAYYIIRLKATNLALGCSDSMQKRIRVLNNCFIAVPSAFTPNGDGLNDYLYPNNAIKAEDLEFRVYNRWGQLVFLSKDWAKKWDGKINGVTQTTGVYVWFLSYTHRDTGQKVFQKGTSTLIR